MSETTAYEAFVDQLVEIAERCVAADRIDGHGSPVRANERDKPLDADESRLKALFGELTREERGALAELIRAERRSAIHDVASFLEWGLSCDHTQLSWKGEPVGPSPYISMHADFISRLEGDRWSDL